MQCYGFFVYLSWLLPLHSEMLILCSRSTKQWLQLKNQISRKSFWDHWTLFLLYQVYQIIIDARCWVYPRRLNTGTESSKLLYFSLFFLHRFISFFCWILYITCCNENVKNSEVTYLILFCVCVDLSTNMLLGSHHLVFIFIFEPFDIKSSNPQKCLYL